MPEEFESVPHAGGNLEFINMPGGNLHFKFSHSSAWAFVAFQVCVSLDGRLLDTVPIRGLGAVAEYPQPSYVSFVISDKEGLFGRLCPYCHKYFRAQHCPDVMRCAYCSMPAHNLKFLTEKQAKFIEAFVNAGLEAQHTGKNVTVKIDEMAEGEWNYSEERQQTRLTCKVCSTVFDILGEFGTCPNCAKRNSFDVLSARISELTKEFEDARDQLIDRHEREARWESLLKCVAEFEATAKDLRDQLLALRMLPHRAKKLRDISFQRIADAASVLDMVLGINLFDNLPEEDVDFLVKMFHRRHVFTHNGGIVDEDYLSRSGDTSVRLGQKIRVKSKDIQRLLPLISKITQNLFQAFEELMPPADGKFARVPYRHFRLVHPENEDTSKVFNWPRMSEEISDVDTEQNLQKERAESKA